MACMLMITAANAQTKPAAKKTVLVAKETTGRGINGLWIQCPYKIL